jgi:sugar lactone lactonase YvrE
MGTLSIVSGNNQTAIIDQALTPVTVQLKDSANNPVVGGTVTVVSPLGAAAVPSTGMTDGSGHFTFTPYLGRAATSYSWTISNGNAPSIMLSGTATNPSNGTIFTLVNVNHSAGNAATPVAGTQANVGRVAGFEQISDGTIYFADYDYCLVRKLTPEGELTNVAGGGVGGCGYGGDNAQALAANLNRPTDVAVDEVNNVLYIADYSNGRIRAVDLGTGIISTAAGGGTAPAPGYGDGNSGAATQLSTLAITLGPNNLLYFSDGLSQRIRTLNTQTLIVNNFMAPPTYPTPCSGASIPIAFYSVNNSDWGDTILFDKSGNMWISAFWSGTEVNNPATTCGGQGAVPAVVRRTPSGQLTAFAGATGGATTDGTWSGNYVFQSPPSIALDPAGNLYFAEYQRNKITWMDAGSGRILTFSGTAMAGYVGEYAPYTPGVQYNAVSRIAFDPNGNMLVADNGNEVLREIWGVASSNKLISKMMITGGNNVSTIVDTPGAQMKVQLTDGSGTPLVGWPLKWSVVDPGGGIYATASLTDASGTTKVLNHAGLMVGAYHFTASFNDPYGNPIMGSPATFTLNATAATAGNIMTVVNTDHSAANSVNIGPTGPNDANMANTGRVVGFHQVADGSVYFADYDYCMVRKLGAHGELTNVAGGGVGGCGYGGDAGQALAANLNRPTDVAVDEVNNVLYIADYANGRIRAVDLTTGVITTVAGGGTAPAPGYGDGNVGTSGQLSTLTITLGPTGNLLYFADGLSQRFRTLNTQTGILNNWLSPPTYPTPCSGASVTLSFYSVNNSDWGNQVIFDKSNNAWVSAFWSGTALNNPATTCGGQGAIPAVVKIAGGTLTAMAGSASSWTCGAATCTAATNYPAASNVYAFQSPPMIALDPNGVLYVSEYQRQRLGYLDATNHLQLFSGDSTANFSGDFVPVNGSGGVVEYNAPTHIFFGQTGRLWIADTGNECLRMVWE